MGGAGLKRVCGVAVTLTALAAGIPGPSVAAPPKKPPQELWSQYPLGGPRSVTAPKQVGSQAPIAKAEHRAPTLRRDAKDGGFRLTPGLAAGLGLAILALLGVRVLLGDSSEKRGKGGRPVRDFLRAHARKEQQQATTGEAQMDNADDRAGAPPGAIASDADRAAARALDSAAMSDLAGVGDHIASVLAAAEAAASNLRAGAEEEANEVRLRVKQEGESARAAARQIVEEAEASGAEIRGDADRYAEDRRRKADEQAAKILSEAKRNAASLAETSQERHRVVLTNIATSEARLRDLAKSLRAVASALDTVVGDRPQADDSERDLEESLRPRVQTAQREGGADS
jgi:hypothetical protein